MSLSNSIPMIPPPMHKITVPRHGYTFREYPRIRESYILLFIILLLIFILFFNL
jgi:hypothetical protein